MITFQYNDNYAVMKKLKILTFAKLMRYFLHLVNWTLWPLGCMIGVDKSPLHRSLARSAARAYESAKRIGVIEIKNMGDQLHFSTRQSSCIISRARFRPRFPASLNGIAASARIGAFECVILGRQRRAAYIIINMLVCVREWV